jgi:hypothetical protein
VPFSQVHAAIDTLDAIVAGTDTGADTERRTTEAEAVLEAFTAWAQQRHFERAAPAHLPPAEE